MRREGAQVLECAGCKSCESKGERLGCNLKEGRLVCESKGEMLVYESRMRGQCVSMLQVHK